MVSRLGPSVLAEYHQFLEQDYLEEKEDQDKEETEEEDG